MIDVEAIDLPGRRSTKTDGDRAPADETRQANALTWGELLRVVHPGDGSHVGWHNDGASDDGAREGAPSDLINSCDHRTGRGAQLALHTVPPARFALTGTHPFACWSDYSPPAGVA